MKKFTLLLFYLSTFDLYAQDNRPEIDIQQFIEDKTYRPGLGPYGRPKE